jgi:hypothetical protein
MFKKAQLKVGLFCFHTNILNFGIFYFNSIQYELLREQ